MKKILLILISALTFVSPLFATPLMKLIFQQSGELADKVRTWNKQCGNKPSYDDTCMKKRYKISGELGQFVALVNDELDGLRDISPDASDDSLKEFIGRRKISEHEIRVALYNIKCLGVPTSDPQCSAEATAIDEEKATLQTEYKRTHAAFDGKWISLHATISPAPKNPQ